MMKTISITRRMVVFLLAAAIIASAEGRVSQSIDSGWKFHLGEEKAAATSEFVDDGWRNLGLPHDWSIEGDYSAKNPSGLKGGWLPGGIGWYRRVIDMPASWQGSIVTAEFEGIYMNSDVWLNGERVGGRPYGYSTFTCDLTSRLKTGRNVLSVRADNSLEPSARWYHGCGIYGHVRLIVTDPLSVPVSGVFVKTLVIRDDRATVSVAVEVRNLSRSVADAEVRLEIISPGGESVAKVARESSVAVDETKTVSQTLMVEAPVLWTLENPAMYLLKTRIVRAGQTVDEITTPFGMRSLRFDSNEGFFLNGKPVKIKGVCEHQGGSPVGAAMPEALLERRLQQLKDMGCNSIRAAHNPQLPAFYDLCDRMGILVMDEIFDGWSRKADQDYGGRFFKDWWQRDLTDWVRRDRNHPSVVFWSIGNETGKDDEHHMSEFIHALDDTRPTTGGAVIHGVDVAGFNGGIVPDDETLEKFHRENPDRPIVMTEEPHTFQTRGFYRTMNSIFKPINNLPDYASPEVFSGGHSAYRSSYDNCGRRLVARNCWRRTIDRSWVMGEYRWTGFDYIGESGWSGRESLAREFNFGVIDLAGFPKDEYYFYQSIWTGKPMVHLLPHWTHPGLEGKAIPVVVYANADEIELFQDGKSLGRKSRSDLFECVWQVPYQAGELKAVAYRKDKAVAETTQRSAGPPVKLEVVTDNSSLTPSRDNLALVSLSVRDANGTLVPDADQIVSLAATGPVRWLGGENGDPVDITPQRDMSRRVFKGLARGFYAGEEGNSAPVEVTALAVLGVSGFADRTKVPIVCERVALRGGLPETPPEIHYTIDGSVPTTSSPVYHEPLELSGTTTVKAAAVRRGEILATVSRTFTLGPMPVKKEVSGQLGDQGDAEDPIHTKEK